MLDIDAALARVENGAVPAADFGEPNDGLADATPVARAGVVRATIDWQDDPVDEYGVPVRSGDELGVRSGGAAPGTVSIAPALGGMSRGSSRIGTTLRYVTKRSGIFLVRVTSAAAGRGGYRLTIDSR